MSVCVFAGRAEELFADRPELIAVVGPLLKARKAIEQQTDDLDRKVLKLARYDAQVRRFMTVPCFKATIDDPTRFKRIDDPTPCFRRDRLDGTHLEVWRRHAPQLSFRSGRCAADPRAEMVGPKGLGDETRQAKWAPNGHSRRRARARDRGERVKRTGFSLTDDRTGQPCRSPAVHGRPRHSPSA